MSTDNKAAKRDVKQLPDYKHNIEAYDYWLLSVVSACRGFVRQWAIDNNVDFKNKDVVSTLSPSLSLPGPVAFAFKATFVPKPNVTQYESVDHYFVNIRILHPHK